MSYPFSTDTVFNTVFNTVFRRGGATYTVTGASSHHRRLGADLATGQVTQLAASGVNTRNEGMHTLAMVRAHRLLDRERAALFALVCQFFRTPRQLRQQLAAYLTQRFA